MLFRLEFVDESDLLVSILSKMSGSSYSRFRLTNKASFRFGQEKSHQIRVSAKATVDLAESPDRYDFFGIGKFESLSLRRTREMVVILAEHVSPEWNNVFEGLLKAPFLLKINENSLYKRCLVKHLNPTGILFNSADEIPSIMGKVELAIVDKHLERLQAPSWVRKTLFRPTQVENLDDNALVACRITVHLWKKGVDEDKPRIFQAERLPVQIRNDINEDLCWFACTVLGIKIRNFGCSYRIRIISVDGRTCRCIFVDWEHNRKAAIWYTSDEDGKFGYCKVYSRLFGDVTQEMLSRNVIFDE